MNVLVTGGEGQVGSEVARLADDGFHARALDRRSLDITNADQISQRLDAVQPDFVVNCAAYTAVDRAEDEPEAAHAVNANAMHLLGSACAERGISVIHLSTDYVFDGSKPEPYVEEDAPNPLGVYGASKLAGEELLRTTTDRHVILRVSWVFGRLGRSFVDTILKLARERDELTVVDDQVGAPSPAVTIAQAIRQIVETASDRADLWGTYHFSTTPALSWCSFARRIVAVAAEVGLLARAPNVLPISTADWPAKAARPLNSRLNPARASATFGCAVEPWGSALARLCSTAEGTEQRAHLKASGGCRERRPRERSV